MSAALQYFDENLPHRPYHTDDLAFGLRISGKGRALLARYIQQNQPHAQFWLVLTLTAWGQRSTGATGTHPHRTSPLKIL